MPRKTKIKNDLPELECSGVTPIMPRTNKTKHDSTEMPGFSGNTPIMPRTNKTKHDTAEMPGCSGSTNNVSREKQVNPYDTDKLQKLFDEASSQSDGSHHDFQESDRSEDEQERIPFGAMGSDGSGSPANDPYADSAGEYGSDSEYNPAEDESDSSDNVSEQHQQDDEDLDRTVSDISNQCLSDQNNSPSLNPVLGTTQTLHQRNHNINPLEPNDVSSRRSPDLALGAIQTHLPNIQQITLDEPLPTYEQVEPLLSDERGNDSSLLSRDAQESHENYQSSRAISTPTNDDCVWEVTTASILEFEFNETNAGPQVHLDGNTSPINVLDHLFTAELVDFIVTCTNAYAENLCSTNRPHTRGSRMQAFKPTDREEIKKFLGLCLLQGHHENPSIRKCFTTTDPLYYHPIYSYTMSGRRFEQILRCLCISEPNSKGMNKVKHFANKVISNFQCIWHPEKELSLDESLLLFRGRLSFRQYIKSKKARYGIKFYVLTTHDGYVLNFIVYEGKNTLEEDRDCSKTAKLVMKLMQPYLDKGHELYMDNFYNSVDLSKKLLLHKTHTVGTLRKDRKGNPKTLFKKKIKKGSHYWRRNGKVYVSMWRDKRVVHMITTKHHPSLIVTTNRYGQQKTKPIEVSEYNKFMSGIDKSDQMMSYYSTPKKTIRWYKKVFFHLLDMMVWNAHYMYKKQCDSKATLLSFRESVINSYLQVTENTLEDLQKMKLPKTGRRKKKTTANYSHVAPEAGHWPELLPLPDNAKRSKVFLRCRACTKNKISKQTSYRCKGCVDKPPLCPGCFEWWHNEHLI